MKPDLLDNGFDAQLANHLVWLKHHPKAPQDMDMQLQRIGAVLRRAEQLMPCIGFIECAEEVEGQDLDTAWLQLLESDGIE